MCRSTHNFFAPLVLYANDQQLESKDVNILGSKSSQSNEQGLGERVIYLNGGRCCYLVSVFINGSWGWMAEDCGYAINWHGKRACLLDFGHQVVTSAF